MQMLMQCVTSSDYGSATSQVTVDAPDAVICTNIYSEEIPYTMGLVKFDVTEDRSASFSRPASGPDYPLYRLYHMGVGPRRKGPPADQLPNFYHAVLTFERSVYA